MFHIFHEYSKWEIVANNVYETRSVRTNKTVNFIKIIEQKRTCSVCGYTQYKSQTINI